MRDSSSTRKAITLAKSVWIRFIRPPSPKSSSKVSSTISDAQRAVHCLTSISKQFINLCNKLPSLKQNPLERNMDKIEVRKDEKSLTNYAHLPEPDDWKMPFLRAPCWNSHVLYLSCSDLGEFLF